MVGMDSEVAVKNTTVVTMVTDRPVNGPHWCPRKTLVGKAEH